jgi:hypothetical protein
MTSVVSFGHERIEPRLDEFVAAAAARLGRATSSVSAGLGRREMGSAPAAGGPTPPQLVRFAAATLSRKSSRT